MGAVRDYVLGAKVINGRGQLLTFGGQVMKTSLAMTSRACWWVHWARWALITEVSLKVLPIAPAQATLRFALDEAQALERCNRWAGQPCPSTPVPGWLKRDRPRCTCACAAQQRQCRRRKRLLAELPGPGHGRRRQRSVLAAGA